MQFLDIRTISFVAMLASILLAVGLQLVHRVMPRDESIQTWSRGATLMGGGFVLIALRGWIPDLFSIVLANAMLVGGIAHIHLGNRIFARLPRGLRLDYWTAAATAVLLAYFTYVEPNLANRIVILSALFAGIAFASARTMFRLRVPQERIPARFVGIFYVLAGGFLLVRALATPWLPHTQDYMQSHNAIHTLASVMGIALSFGLAVGLTLLVAGRMQNTLRESEARLATVFRVSPLGIALTRLKDGEIVDVNDAMIELNGYSREEMIGRSTLELQIWLDPADREHFVHLLKTEGRVRNLEVRIRRRSGEIRTMLFYAEIIDLSGESYVLTQVIDITERKQAENTLHELNATLEKRVGEELARSMASERMLIQQSRLAAMGEMISNIAHQWRQPLNTLGLLLSNLKDAYEYGELNQEMIDRQAATGNRLVQKMSSTIDDFRNFFKPNKEKRLFSLSIAATEAQGIIGQSLADHGIRLEVSELAEISAYGYPNEFSQVLLNLLNNAKEAILNRGTAGGLVTLLIAEENGRPTVRIADNGGGIPPDVLPKIFDPYFTTKEKGTGIGLYMSRMIMEHMEGGIEARNIDGGAEFILNLPSAESSAASIDA